MSSKKKRGRIRQTRTEFQKVFDRRPEMLGTFSWHDRLFEVLHISAALVENDYQTVNADFYIIADYVNEQYQFQMRPFHFNLSHTIKLIQKNNVVLEKIRQTCFKDAFDNILAFYFDLIGIEPQEFNPKPQLLFRGYAQIRDGRSDTSILCKYLMMTYAHHGRPDPFNLFGLKNVDEILTPMNISTTMATFPPSTGMSEYFDLEYCREVWMYNYSKSPLMPMKDTTDIEQQRFSEMELDKLQAKYKELYFAFCELNLLAVYEQRIAEIQMGFAARISNLVMDVIDFVKIHKGEIAELVIRSALETYIVASWLIKKQDPALYQRFREYSTGREKFMAEKLMAKTDSEEIKEEMRKIATNAVKDAGVRDIQVAIERGDIFEMRIDQMADEVWGKDNEFYFLYKRSSEVTHGHWRVIAQYHLAKSLNPMHNGLYSYNDNPNHFSGLTPAFMGMMITTNFLLAILNDIDAKQVDDLKEKMLGFSEEVLEKYMQYFKKYILEDQAG